MVKKNFYGVRLNNYFSPSFCSSHKVYFGILNDIKTFIESMGSIEQSCMIRNAFKRYLSGETDATHEVAYIKQKLIENVELIAEGEVKLDHAAWEFLNVWYHPQYMEIDSAVVKMDIKKEKIAVSDKELLFKIIKASFAMRRKTLLNSLGSAGLMGIGKKELAEILAKLKISENVRAENLSLEEYVKITDLMHQRCI